MEKKFNIKFESGAWYLRVTEEAYDNIRKLSARMYQKIHSCLDWDKEQVSLYLDDVRQFAIEPSSQIWYGYDDEMMLIPAIWGYFYVFADEFQDIEILNWGDWLVIPNYVARFLNSDEVQ